MIKLLLFFSLGFYERLRAPEPFEIKISEKISSQTLKGIEFNFKNCKHKKF
jgi:hypothetical protein